jgi:hypothetical protein
MTTYKILRFFEDDEIGPCLIRGGLTLEQAQAHCNDPETSSRTATGELGRSLTERFGPWFEGYEEEQESLVYTAHGLVFRKVSASNIDVWFEGDSGAPFTTIGTRVSRHHELVAEAEQWWADNRDDINKHLENHVG